MDAANEETTVAPLVGELPREVTVNAVVPLETFTLRYAMAVLKSFKGNKSRAAKALCITRWTLQRLEKRAVELGMVA